MKLNHYIYTLIAGLVLMLRPMYLMTWQKVLPTL